MANPNRYGLKRYIPEDVARQVRQECKFGCVVCGNIFAEYHHFDPPFKDADRHSAQGIVLLCPNCHDDFATISIESMREARSNPKCAENGVAGKDQFLFRLGGVPKVVLGRITATSGQILRNEDQTVLGLSAPEISDGPSRLACELNDHRGELILKISDNVLTVGIDHFDIETTAQSLIIRRKLGDIILWMTTNRENEICITHLDTAFSGGTVSCTPQNGLSIRSLNGGLVNVSGNICGDIGIWIADRNCLIGASSTRGARVSQSWS